MIYNTFVCTRLVLCRDKKTYFHANVLCVFVQAQGTSCLAICWPCQWTAHASNVIRVYIMTIMNCYKICICMNCHLTQRFISFLFSTRIWHTHNSCCRGRIMRSFLLICHSHNAEYRNTVTVQITHPTTSTQPSLHNDN